MADCDAKRLCQYKFKNSRRKVALLGNNSFEKEFNDIKLTLQ